MPSSTIWPLEPHTAAKHRMLEQYLGAWFPIMASTERRVFYLDGFAGPGRYRDGERGSPLIALDTLLDHQHFPRWTDTEFLFGFLESDRDRAANLKLELERYFKDRGRPPNVRIRVVNTTFEDGAEDIIASVAGKTLAPTFAFIDPFGFKGIPMKLIGRLLSSPKCEVLVNFMFDTINRFATAANEDEVHRRLAETFDCEDFTAAPPSGRPRQEYLVELYKARLQNRGFPYVRSMEMVSLERNRTVYHLVYGTKHPKGLSVMKRAMWKLDPQLGRRFTPREADIPTLFGTAPDLGPLHQAILQKFSGRTVGVETVEAFVNEKTDYLADSHLRRSTLTPMEQEGLIVGVEGRKSRGFPAGCRITFR